MGANKITYIYALMDADNVKYIGKRDKPNKRLIERIKYGSKDKNLKITTKTHEILINYCKINNLKIFGFV